MSNKTTIGDKLKTYMKHPGSFVVLLLVLLGAFITFAVLLFLIAYILLNGLPHITPSLFSLHYTSENASVVPALQFLSEFSRQSFLLSMQEEETNL